MNAAAKVVLALGMGAVALVLAFGLITVLRAKNPDLSQKLMRWRVGVQLAVIALILGILWFRG
ncbi:MAG: twin transmembrane helix small protein [Methylocapsa sp.]|nr:twin transmembrane helix small protein [Methylocapsa sp.]